MTHNRRTPPQSSRRGVCLFYLSFYLDCWICDALSRTIIHQTVSKSSCYIYHVRTDLTHAKRSETLDITGRLCSMTDHITLVLLLFVGFSTETCIQRIGHGFFWGSTTDPLLFYMYRVFFLSLSPRAWTRVSTGILCIGGARSVICLFFLWGFFFPSRAGGSEPPGRRDKPNIFGKCLLFCRGGDHLNTTHTPLVFSSQAIGF